MHVWHSQAQLLIAAPIRGNAHASLDKNELLECGIPQNWLKFVATEDMTAREQEDQGAAEIPNGASKVYRNEYLNPPKKIHIPDCKAPAVSRRGVKRHAASRMRVS
jgi:hypothetical protein